MTHATHLPTTPIEQQPAPSRQPKLDQAHSIIDSLLDAVGRGVDRAALDQRLAQQLIDTERDGYANALTDVRERIGTIVEQRRSLADARSAAGKRRLEEHNVHAAAAEFQWAATLQDQASAVGHLLDTFL